MLPSRIPGRASVSAGMDGRNFLNRQDASSFADLVRGNAGSGAVDRRLASSGVAVKRPHNLQRRVAVCHHAARLRHPALFARRLAEKELGHFRRDWPREQS